MLTPEQLFNKLDNDDLEELEAADILHCLGGGGGSPLDTFMGYCRSYHNRWLLEKPSAFGYTTTSPIYCLGSGPSLTEHLPWLAENQGNIVIICGHSTIPILDDHGIVPDFVTPMERVYWDGIMDVPVHDDTIYAGLLCVPELPQAYKKHCANPPGGNLGTWLGVHNPCHWPRISGAAAVRMASLVGSPHTVLMGHDLCMNDGEHHADKRIPLRESLRDGSTIPCYDGQVRETTQLWLDAMGAIARLKLKATTPCSTGAILSGVQLNDALPVGSGKGLMHNGESFSVDMAEIERKWRSLPIDLRNYARTGKLPLNENAILIQACMHPLWLTFSIEKRLGRHPDVLSWFRDAAHRTLDLLATYAERFQDDM